MNVLFVIHFPVFGGPHNQALLLRQALASRGSRVVTVVPTAGKAAERLSAGGLDVLPVPLQRFRSTLNPIAHLRSFGSFPGDVRAVRRVIRECEIDVVQLGGLINPHAALAGRLERRAVVWQILDTRPPIGVRRMMMPFVRRWADVVMTTGRAVAEAHPGATELDERLRVFYPTVDLSRFSREQVDRAAARDQWRLAPDDLVVVSVGNLNPQKGHEYLLRALALGRRTRPNLKLLVVGEAHETHVAYRRNLLALARELGLSVGRDVVFTDGLTDVRPALAASDVFALASVPRSEGAPNAVLEAMAMELPVVATDVGAVREVVEDGETGFVVPPTDAAALSAAILRLLAPGGTRDEFGVRARRRVTNHFSIEQYARVHLEAYDHALRLASGRRSRW